MGDGSVDILFQKSIAILLPAYNEQSTITKIIENCLQYTPHVYVIDDGSTDETLSRIKQTSALIYSNVVNQGKGAILLQGFHLIIEKNYSGVITLDADGQHNPDDLTLFFERIQKNPEALIIGARRLNTKNAPLMRLFANKIADFFISCAAKKWLADTQSGYRYYPAAFLKKYFLQSPAFSHFAFETEILISAVKIGVAVDYVDIESCYPVCARKSYYRTGKDSWEIAKSVMKGMWW